MINVAIRGYEAAAWLRKKVGVVGPKDLPAEPSEEEFSLGLRSGIILCNVLNKVQPGAVSKFLDLAPRDEGYFHPIFRFEGLPFLQYLAVLQKPSNSQSPQNPHLRLWDLLLLNSVEAELEWVRFVAGISVFKKFFKEGNMDELGLRFQKLSFDSISRLSLLMNRFGGGGRLAGNVHFVSLNLTSDLEDHNGFSMCLKEDQKMPEQMKEEFLEDEEDEEEQSDSEVQIQEPEMDFEDSKEWESEDDIVEETSPILENADPISEADMVEESSPILENADPISEADIVEETSPISENVVPIFEADMNATSEAVLSVVEDTSSDNVILPEIASEDVDSVVEGVETASSDEKLQGSFFQIIAQLWGIAPLIAVVVSAAATLFFWKRNVHVSAMDSVPEVSMKKLQHSRSEEQLTGIYGEGSQDQKAKKEMIFFLRCLLMEKRKEPEHWITRGACFIGHGSLLLISQSLFCGAISNFVLERFGNLEEASLIQQLTEAEHKAPGNVGKE